MRAAKSNCSIETFDCTVDGLVPAHIASRTRFHKVCLGAENRTVGGKQYLSWDSLNNLVGNRNGTIDMLKIDIEGWEYDAIPWIVGASNAPVEIAVEMHSGVLYVNRTGRPRYMIDEMKTLEQRLDLFRTLYSAGYYILSVTGNMGWRGAAEYSFARLHCANHISIPSVPMSDSDIIKNIVRIRRTYMSPIPDMCRTRYCEENRAGFPTT